MTEYTGKWSTVFFFQHRAKANSEHVTAIMFRENNAFVRKKMEALFT